MTTPTDTPTATPPQYRYQTVAVLGFAGFITYRVFCRDCFHLTERYDLEDQAEAAYHAHWLNKHAQEIQR